MVPVDPSLTSYHQESGHTYESGPADQGQKGAHADTEEIAKDLAACLANALSNTNNSVNTISINDQSSYGSPWAGGKSTGVWVETRGSSTYDVHYKLELEISQSGAGTAYCELIVSSGRITGFRNLRRGYDFTDPAVTPVTLTYKQYSRVRRYDASLGGWKLLESGDDFYYQPNADFLSSSNSGSDPIQIATTAITGGSIEVVGFDAVSGLLDSGSVIKLRSTNGPFKIRVQDGLADQGLGLVYREVNSITELPVKCYNDFGPVKVIGDADIDQDDYYVRFSTKDKGEFGEGSWIETVGYYQDESESSALEGIDTILTNGTMPVTLIPFFNNNTDHRL